MQRTEKLAMKNEEMTYTVIGQTILDEAKIGPEAIRISNYSVEEASYLWEVGRQWNLVNGLRTACIHRKISKNVNAMRKNHRLAELWSA